ncbi:MAG: hypothetical protein ACO3EZ_18725 [Prochlorotrichaceae cyanobacterium]
MPSTPLHLIVDASGVVCIPQFAGMQVAIYPLSPVGNAEEADHQNMPQQIVQDFLTQVTTQTGEKENLADVAAELFGLEWGVDLDLPSREPIQPIELDL